MKINGMIRWMFILVLMGWAGAVGAEPPKSQINSIGMEFVQIPAGSFVMGAPFSVTVSDNEIPRHPVKIGQPFYLSRYEVTQEQWEAIMGSNPSKFKEAKRPVEQVNWHDVQRFIRRLNAKEGTKAYRLPTEAEWEYAARAGAATKFSWGEGEKEAGQQGWYSENSGDQTHPVGQKQPNSWGVYDMAGNVWEWVNDWYDGKYYDNSPETDPAGPSEGTHRIIRGGSWLQEAADIRPSNRDVVLPDYRANNVGFRLLKSSP